MERGEELYTTLSERERKGEREREREKRRGRGTGTGTGGRLLLSLHGKRGNRLLGERERAYLVVQPG